MKDIIVPGKNQAGVAGYHPLKRDIKGLCIRCHRALTGGGYANYCRSCQHIVFDEDSRNISKKKIIQNHINRLFKTIKK